jgi:hypothetical protein
MRKIKRMDEKNINDEHIEEIFSLAEHLFREINKIAEEKNLCKGIVLSAMDVLVTSVFCNAFEDKSFKYLEETLDEFCKTIKERTFSCKIKMNEDEHEPAK